MFTRWFDFFYVFFSFVDGQRQIIDMYEFDLIWCSRIATNHIEFNQSSQILLPLLQSRTHIAGSFYNHCQPFEYGSQTTAAKQSKPSFFFFLFFFFPIALITIEFSRYLQIQVQLNSSVKVHLSRTNVNCQSSSLQFSFASSLFQYHSDFEKKNYNYERLLTVSPCVVCRLAHTRREILSSSTIVFEVFLRMALRRRHYCFVSRKI